MSSNENNSSLGSYVNSIVGAGQSALGSLTGNSADKAHGESTKDKAHAEKEASHTVGKLGPYAVSGSGGISQDSPDRATGSWNQTVGSAKESIGNLTGAEGLKRDGIAQNREGKGQEAQGQLSDYGDGMGDRAKGAIGGVGAKLMGDGEKEEEMRRRHDDGKTKQRSAEADIKRDA